MTDADAQAVPASPLCRSGISYWLAHDLSRDDVCARCGWALPGREDEPKEEEL